MSDESANSLDSADRLGTVLAACIEAVDKGEADADMVVARYPEYAAELREFFAAQERAERLAAPLQSILLAPQTVNTADAASALPNPLGDFRIVREVGRGGMGVVYEAEQLSLGRRVALKVLPLAAALDPRGLQRFQNEARAAAGLHHTNIAPVYAVGSEHGIPYYAMQFIDGQTLAKVIADLRLQLADFNKQPLASLPDGAAPTGPYSPEAACQSAIRHPQSAIGSTSPVALLSTEGGLRGREYYRAVAGLGVQAAEALDCAHQLGVVHRDIKPANLMVEAGGHLWVTDFGLARVQADASITTPGDVVGTLRYMSPEQALAKRAVIDHRTDVYSLGATLYELLTLRPAFPGKDRQEIMRQIAFEDPPVPRRLNRGVPAELEAVVLKAMEKSPTDRYGTAQELADDLRRWLDDRPILARRPSWVRRTARWARRHKPLVGAALAVLVMAAVLGGGTWLWWAQQRAGAEGKTQEALQDAAPLLRQGDPHDPALVAAVQRAQAQLGSGLVGPGLRDRVAQLLRDVDMLTRLENARLQVAAGGKETVFDHAGANRLYAEAFQEYGLDVLVLEPHEAAQRVRASAIGPHLVVALDDWAIHRTQVQPKGATPLRAVADLADDDPWRRRRRQAAGRGDRAALQRLAQEEGTAREAPANLVLLARDLRNLGNWTAAVQLLRRAHAAHSADFWINFELSYLPPQKKLRAMAVQFARAAVVLRPQSPIVYLNLGNALSEHKDFAEAEAAYRQAIALKRNFSLAYSALGDVLADQNKPKQAKEAHEKAIALEPTNAAAYVNLGAFLYDQGKLDAAEQAVRKAIALKSDYAVAYRNLGMVLADKKKFAASEKAHRKAIALNPHHAVAHHHLGRALHDRGKLAAAVDAYRQAIKLQLDLADAHHDLGIALSELGRPAQAEAACRKAIEFEPDHALAHNTLGNALRNQGKLAHAEDAYRKAIRLKPDYHQAYYNLGITLRQQNKLKGAEDAYRKATTLKPDDFEPWINLGAVLGMQGKLPEAEQVFREAIALRPGDARAYGNLGLALLRDQRKAAEAEAAFRSVVNLQPKDAQALHFLGVALGRQNKLAEAEQAYRKAIALKPDYAEAYHDLGVAWRNQNKLKEAVTAFRQAIKWQPKNARVAYDLAGVLQQQHNLAAAEDAYRHAIAVKPDYHQAYYSLGSVLADQDKLGEAEDAYRQAIALKPDFAEAHCHLAGVLTVQCRFADALAACKRGHELGSRRVGWRFPSAEWVRMATRFVALDDKLPQVLLGEVQPADAAERIALAQLCQHRQRYAAAARFYAEAFSADPKQAEKLGAPGGRYSAACVAALAGCGQGRDANQTADKERARLRRLAREWLHADLLAWARLLENEPGKVRSLLAKTMNDWHQDKDFAGVRGGALAKLPAAERLEWQKMWKEVAALKDRAAESVKKAGP
jgi:tetratricopeptide (TPR) repeat protein/serine/threonine protein kinase